jgi:hypothetical protein
LLQLILIADDAAILLGKENQVPKEFSSYVVLDFEQFRDNLLADQIGHTTDIERCCAVAVGG